MKSKVLKGTEVLSGGKLPQLNILKFSNVATYFTDMN